MVVKRRSAGRSARTAHPGRQSARDPDVVAARSRAARATGPGGKPFFDPRRPVAAVRAPGRLDVLGGIGDYSGCRVLEWPIAAAAVAMAQPADDGLIVLRSQDLWERGVAGDPEVHADLSCLAPFDGYAEFRARLSSWPEASWTAYVLGAFAVLMAEKKARFRRGTRILIDSRIPAGKGVASSAALEVASLLAIARAHGIRLQPAETPALAQKIENEVVGAPCGIMDQITACFASAGALLPIRCQPAQALPALALPEGVELAGIDSGVRHDVGGQAYRSVRTGAAMGYRIIAEMLRLKVKPRGKGRVEVDDRVLRGYLANLSPRRFRREFEKRLPERIRGSHFLDCFAGVTDAQCTIEPRREYPVRAPTAHPVGENFRATAFAGLVEGYRESPDPELLKAMGELMLSSHDSYSRCGLGDAATDLLVELAMEEGPPRGIYGAKSSGGGSGGTVVILLDRRGRPALSRIAAAYQKKTGRPAQLVRGTSPGALK